MPVQPGSSGTGSPVRIAGLTAVARSTQNRQDQGPWQQGNQKSISADPAINAR